MHSFHQISNMIKMITYLIINYQLEIILDYEEGKVNEVEMINKNPNKASRDLKKVISTLLNSKYVTKVENKCLKTSVCD